MACANLLGIDPEVMQKAVEKTRFELSDNEMERELNEKKYLN